MRLAVIVTLLVLGLAMLGAAAWLYTPDKPRAALEARYAGPPSTFIEAAGLRLHVRDTGRRDAPALLMLHGFGSSLHTWEAWAALLEGEYRVIRFDLPGFGLTGADPSSDYGDPRAIAVVAALMDRLGLARASLIGNSMGGRIAWMFAAAHADRVDRLVLISPDGFASPGLAYGAPPRVPLTLRLLPYVLPTPLLRATLAPAYADPAAMTDAVVARYRDMMLAPGVRAAIVARTEQYVLVDPEPLLRRVRAPTLLLWGEKDAMIPHGNAADYLRVLPDARLVSLPTLGHVPQEENPALAVDAVRRFLAQ